MKALILAVILFSLIPSASLAYANYYSTLEELFNAGEVPDPKEIQDKAWSGRCFFKEIPFKPVAASYILTDNNFTEYGPISGINEVLGVATTWDKRKRATYFDKMSLAEVEEFFGDELEFHISQLTDDGLVTYIYNATSIVVTSSNYLVQKITNPANEAVAMCYYFKSTK